MSFLPAWLRETTPSILSASFVTVLVGLSSSLPLTYQAAQAAGATQAQFASWVWAVGIGVGITSLVLSFTYKTPICGAWSAPGAALLITALSGYTMAEAIGIFIGSSLLICLSGITGIFERFMGKIPKEIGAAMLAGVLVRFGMHVFTSMQENVLLPMVMLLSYLLIKRWQPKFAVLFILLVGVLISHLQGALHLGEMTVALATPVFVAPAFSLQAFISVSLPLFIVTMTAQNIPGVMILRAHGYKSPTSVAMMWTGGMGLLLAPFGKFGLNMSAITAAICMSEDVHPDKNKRYLAAVWTGIFYLIVGVFGATVAVAFDAFPPVFVATLAGIALFSTIGNGLTLALANEQAREPALIAFLTTASGVTLWGIGSAFWGIVAGIMALVIATLGKKRA